MFEKHVMKKAFRFYIVILRRSFASELKFLLISPCCRFIFTLQWSMYPLLTNFAVQERSLQNAMRKSKQVDGMMPSQRSRQLFLSAGTKYMSRLRSIENYIISAFWL